MNKRKMNDTQVERGGTAYGRAMIAVGITAAVLALAYLAGAFFFAGHYYWRTQIDGTDYSFRSKEQVRERMLTDGTVFFLEGWATGPEQEKLEQALGGFVCAYEFTEPQEGDAVPTKLQNPKWMQCINMVTEMYSLPAYNGIDPNPLIFLTYIFFFGFMFADVAYGIIIFAISLAITRMYRPKGTMGYMFHLGQYLGISTAICGIFCAAMRN